MTMPMPGLLANYIIGGAQGPVPNASVPEPNMTPAGPAVPNPTTVTPDVPAGANMSPALPPPVSAPPSGGFDAAYDAMIQKESGGNSRAVNPKTGALGSFQLMPKQALALGYTPQDILNMPADQQKAELYPKYLALHGLSKDKMSPGDIGVAQAAPAFVGKPDDTVVYQKGSEEARLNPGWQDANGAVTVGKIKSFYGGAGQASGAPATPNPLGDFITAGGSPGQVQHSRTTVEGIPETPEDIARRGDALGNAKADVVSAYAPAMQAAAENRIAAIDAQQRAQEKADLQEQQKALAKTTYDSAIADEKSATQAVLDDKAPKPFGGNTFSLILATIGQAMGAYGAAITKTRNFAADMINQFLDRDMQTWKEKHLDLKYKAESLSKLTSQRRSDFDFEANAHARLQDQVTMRELQVAQANTQNADQQTRLGLTLASLQERYDGHEEELQRLARDHSQTTTSITEKQTGAAGPEEEAKRTRQLVANGEDLGTVEAARQQAGRKGRIPLDKDQTATAEKLSKELEGLNGAETEVRAALHAMDEGKQKYGSVPGLGGGDLVPDWAYSMAQRLPGTGATGLAQKAEDARQTRQLVNRALTIGVVETVGKGHVGIERSPQLVEKLKAGASGLLEESDARKQLTDTLQQLQSRRRTFLAGVDDPMVRRQIDEESPQFAPVESAKPYQPSGTP